MTLNIDWLVVGLGNPGEKYAHTRHNIGWMIATDFAAKYNRPIMQLDRLYMQSSVRIAGKLVLIAMPTTFMNLSGDAVLKISNEYKLLPSRIIVIADEFNFPLGKVHAKVGGSDGGHNGIFDVMDKLDSNDFIKLRCGISKNFGSGELVDYVLSEFNHTEKDELIAMKIKAIDAIEQIIKVGKEFALPIINSGKLWLPKETSTEKDQNAEIDNNSLLHNEAALDATHNKETELNSPDFQKIINTKS